MTLQEAKDQVAKIHCYDRWEVIDWRSMDEINERTKPPFMEEKLLEEAAELYARSKWDEACDEQRKAIDKHTADIVLRRADIFEAPTPEFKP